MQNAVNLISQLSTVSSYGPRNNLTTCNDVALTIASINYDISYAYKIELYAGYNGTLLFYQAGYINAAYLRNFFSLSSSQGNAIQGIVTSLLVCVNEYNSYQLTLLSAAYQYYLASINLQIYKTGSCSCPALLSASASTAFASIDSDLMQIQGNVSSIEANIRAQSNSVISAISIIEPQMQMNTMFQLISQTLTTISNLCSGYLVLTTTSTINSTVVFGQTLELFNIFLFNLQSNCDDAINKVALIQNMIVLYTQKSVEAAKNKTYILYNWNNLNAYQNTYSNSLTSAQNKMLTAVSNLTYGLASQFSKYIIALTVSNGKLLIGSTNAQRNQAQSCNCTQALNSTSTGSKFHSGFIFGYVKLL